MCAICILSGWNKPAPPVQLELSMENAHGHPLECGHCGTPTEDRERYAWCPRCRSALVFTAEDDRSEPWLSLARTST